MKTTLKKVAAVGLTALLVGNAAAQSVSKPVGYETITIPNGFSYAGLRLHEAVLLAGAVDSVSGADITLATGGGASLVPGAVHIIEVVDGDAAGAVTTFTPADNSDTVTLDDDLSDNFAGGDSFTIRPAATLASVFGVDNSAGIDSGAGGPDGDVIYIPDGTGGFDRYYYDSFNGTTFDATWANAADSSPVDATTVPIIYTDGLIFLGAGTPDNTFVVSGSVKLTNSSLVLQEGFNYIGTVYPVGSTLGSAFGENNEAGLTAGAGGPDGDVVYIPNGADFDRYYFDSFNGTTFGATWADAADSAPVDSTTVSFDDASGAIVLHPGADSAVLFSAPSFYSTL